MPDRCNAETRHGVVDEAAATADGGEVERLQPWIAECCDGAVKSTCSATITVMEQESIPGDHPRLLTVQLCGSRSSHSSCFDCHRLA